MTATKTVAQSPSVRKSSPHSRANIHFNRLFAPNHGVVVLIGFGAKIRVDKGHLILEDGIGDDRRFGRFPRVHHGLRRIVVIGNDGSVSLAALQWLADQNICFSMLDRDGSILLSTGPVAASDTRLRRVQACAQHSPAAVDIVRHIVRLKLNGQERVAREKLADAVPADAILGFSKRLDEVLTIDDLRVFEAHAAAVYWNAWRTVPVQFPKADLPRVPEHWRTFGTRRSPISGTSRRPPNPVNAILNYLYTLLESETRLAISALGLDPGFGLLHVDHATRDSLVYDLMEPIRPTVDAYVLDWLKSSPINRSWFFEERDGCCRLMSETTVRLADTAQTWSREVAPVVEWFAETLASTSDSIRVRAPGTRLTQRRRYEGNGGAPPGNESFPKPQTVCTRCGLIISYGNRFCPACGEQDARERWATGREAARQASKSPEVLRKISERMKSHRDDIRDWRASELPVWLTDEVYLTRIQPALDHVSRQTIADALGVDRAYVYRMVKGDRIPHRRHWAKLAELVGYQPA